MNLNNFYEYKNTQDTSEKRKLFNSFVKINILDTLNEKQLVNIELDSPNYSKQDIDDLLLQCLNSDLNGKVSGESIFISTKDYGDQDFYVRDNSGTVVLSVDMTNENIEYMKNKNLFEDEKDFMDFQIVVDWLKQEVSNILVFN